ncbi:MAG: DUF6713 family protein [Cyanobacteria bacterium J06635_15]
MKNIAFYLGMGTLFTHELDAMPNHEWRILPLTSWLSDEVGMIAFILMHIPLFAILLALVSSHNEKIRIRSRLGIGIFLIAHGGLHILFMSHRNYEFSSMLSSFLIFGGALLGLVYLLLEYREIQVRHVDSIP